MHSTCPANIYSLRSELLVACMDVSRCILVLDTSISTTSNLERREYMVQSYFQKLGFQPQLQLQHQKELTIHFLEVWTETKNNAYLIETNRVET